MSNDGVLGIVVSHGTLAAALVAAAEEITGRTGVLTAVSNTGCDRTRLEERVQAAIGDRDALVFVDLPSGSCFLATLHRVRNLARVRVVTGVNLPMVLDFLCHPEEGLQAAADRATATGATAIRAAACPSS